MAALRALVLLGQLCTSSLQCEPAPSAAAEVSQVPDQDPPQQVLEVDPQPSCQVPLCGSLGARLYCIEGYESGHFGGAYNSRSGAAGWLQWLPGTARAWGVIVGNRGSEWLAAARIAALGEGFFRSLWVPLQRGWC